jgi:hypothetical protein
VPDLSPGEIEEIREEAEQQLLSGARVLVHSSESDGAGGQEADYPPGPEFDCAIAPIGRSSQGGTAGNRISEASTHVVTCPASIEVRSVDRIEIEGVIYAVTALREFGALNFTRRVEVKAL